MTAQEKPTPVLCPHCGIAAEWVENSAIYGKRYGKSYMMWLCRPCNAYVGCHNNTRLPLGTMANKELRQWRIKAHDAFDPLWRNGAMKRDEAYVLLSRELGREVHIGQSDIEQCKEIIYVSSNLLL